jgi:hypothetical protein
MESTDRRSSTINENPHVPLVLSLAPAPLIYKRNYLVRGDEFNREDDAIDFDVVTELVFSDRDACVAWIEKLGVDAVAAPSKEARFIRRPTRERTEGACVVDSP